MKQRHFCLPSKATTELIDGFESPLGMELLATIDWLTHKDGVAADRDSIKKRLRHGQAARNGRAKAEPV